MMKLSGPKPLKKAFDEISEADKFCEGDAKLSFLKEKLAENVFNPTMALQLLNFAQKNEHPEAYEPEIEMQFRKKKELLQQQCEGKKYGDALFDFEGSLDNLSEVS